MNRMQELRDLLAASSSAITQIRAKAKSEERDLSEDEMAVIETHLDSTDATKADIEKLEATQARVDALDARALGATEYLQSSQGRKSEPDALDIEVGKDRREDDPKHGFKSGGYFLQAVKNAGLYGGVVDDNLAFHAAATTFGSTQSGEDGGFLVPPEFNNLINSHILDAGSFLEMTSQTLVSGNSMTFRKDETTPWGSDGIRCTWEDEAATATQTKPLVGKNVMTLNKLLALVPVTDELLEDAVALESHITERMGRSIQWKTNDSLVNGTGAGQPLGFMNASALVTVAKESGQTADTINTENIANMFARMPQESMGRAVWIINPDAFPQIITLVISSHAIWTPQSAGLQGAPAGSLMGRPIIMSQSAQTLGDLGDIALVDWGSYHTLLKSGGVRVATSIHLFFDSEQTAFRASFRLDGQPWLASSITPNNGSNNLSPFVTLAARA